MKRQPTPSRSELELLLKQCLCELLHRDELLLVNDVSERAIAHKLAEYLQKRIWWLDVDCEYNRDATRGPREPKAIWEYEKTALRDLEELVNSHKEDKTVFDKLERIRVYPDIIVHRRGSNDKNLLVIELKKKPNKVDFDHEKLLAFTSQTGPNAYRFTLGVLVVWDTRTEVVQPPELTWFQNGSRLPPVAREVLCHEL